MTKSVIMVVVGSKGNRELLQQTLQQYYEVKFSNDEESLKQTFDIAIFDGQNLNNMRRQIETRRIAEPNVFLPMLLITSRQDVGILTNHLWQSIDELLFAPIERMELIARVEMLLRARKYSLELAHMNARIHEIATIEERQRIGRELHDSVSQTLFLMSTLAQSIPFTQKKDPALAAQQVAEVGQLSRSALSEMRLLLIELRPESIMRSTLKELIDQLILAAQGRRPISISADVDIHETLPETVHLALYRITQEALTNIVKHSEALEAHISLRKLDDKLEIRIKDNGLGFNTNIVTNGLGLQGMKERVAEIGAHLTISSTPDGTGTELIISLPFPV